MSMSFGPRRGTFITIPEETAAEQAALSPSELSHFEELDLIYRSLCALMYNYVPTSGHPGGSISSGRFVASLLLHAMDYDLSDPDRVDADIISYAAGHKAMGLYAMWALRNEIARIAAPELLPRDERKQLRLEDLLGFRRNPITKTKLFAAFQAKALDGHPTPTTPFIKLSTGASGVGIASSLGLAWGAADAFGEHAPRVHIIEGEGGLTPGRVSEALAAAGTASLHNATLHLDWNQASIDSNHVCRDGGVPGEYVQWTPQELCWLHDWNVISVEDGRDFQQIAKAQEVAASLKNGQPTAIIYRTVKGWQYGIEGKASHGAGHKLCSAAFFEALTPLIERTGGSLPTCTANELKCQREGIDHEMMEACFWEALGIVRASLEQSPSTAFFAQKLRDARKRLTTQKRLPRAEAPEVAKIFEEATNHAHAKVPKELQLLPDTTTTLRAELGKALHFFNVKSKGAILAAAADLLGSTSTTAIAAGFPEGFWNAKTNPGARLLSLGGICEDAMSGILSGLSSFGHHIGVGSSYGAFLAPLGHIAARLHAIGEQAARENAKTPCHPMVLVCAHAGLKTGEDGPTHADPQPLQLLQENFPKGMAITLTPWDPAEIFPLLSQALTRRPALIAPFVTRPNETVLDRKQLGLAPAHLATQGIYLLRKAKGTAAGSIVLQGSGVTYAFLTDALPKLKQEGVELNIYYVASAELFDCLSAQEQAAIFPEQAAMEAMGITGFTLPTMYRWIRSDIGRKHTLSPFQHGHYLGSGQAEMVLAEAGLDGQSQFNAIMRYVEGR